MTPDEIAILGCVIQWPDQSLPFLTEQGIRPDMFGTAAARLIFRTAVTEWLEKRPCDVVGIASALGDALPSVGGASGLYELVNGASIPATVGHYADAVKEQHAKRKLAKSLADNLSALSHSSAAEIMAAVESDLGAIAQTRDTARIPTTNEIVMKVAQNLAERTTQGKMVGMSTGILRLDEETGGIRPGGYWVIAGPTKGGKSALVRFMVRAIGISQKKPVLIFGLEMSNDDTVEALLATEGKISASNMRDGKMTTDEYAKLHGACKSVAESPIYFRDDVYSIAGIRSYVRQLRAIVPDLAAVVVDYLQLAEGSGNEERREGEIAAISKALRRMAKDEGLAVIALAQLNDDGELRECRAIGMDATVQVTIELTDNPNTRTLRLRQRQGKTGMGLPVAFVGETLSWHDLAPCEVDEEEPKKKKGFWKK